MGGLLVDGVWAQLLAGYLCDALASSLRHHAVVAGELMQNWLSLTSPSAARAARRAHAAASRPTAMADPRWVAPRENHIAIRDNQVVEHVRSNATIAPQVLVT